MYKLDLEKTEEPEIKLPTSVGSKEKEENSRKTSTSVSLIIPKCVCRSQQTVENCERHGNTRTPYLSSMQVKKQQLESYGQQQTGSNF